MTFGTEDKYTETRGSYKTNETKDSDIPKSNLSKYDLLSRAVSIEYQTVQEYFVHQHRTNVLILLHANKTQKAALLSDQTV